jgi:glycosyltransferase involved in cell wall biosynthesis
MDRSSVLIVSHSSGFYGAERSLLTVARGLVDHGFDITVLLPGKGRLHDELERKGIKTVVWRYYGWIGRKRRTLKGAYRLVFNISSSLLFFISFRSNYGCVYTNTITTNFGVLLSALNRIPHVWHVREFVHEDMGAEFDFPRSFSRITFLKNNRLSIYNSRSVEMKFLKYFGAHDSVVIYNGVRPLGRVPEYSIRKIDKLSKARLVMVGSLHEGKGHLDAIEALPHVCARYPNAQLIIAGTGDEKYRKRIEDRAMALRVERNIKFVGYVNNAQELLNSADIFLMCSRSEAFGRVTVEAMSVGCPVAGAASGGTPEIIENGISGLLYETGNPIDLAQVIIRLIGNPVERRELSRGGLLRVSYFDEKKCIDEIADQLRNKIYLYEQ